MNSIRMEYLFTYLDGLTKLTSNEYRCNTEIMECIGWIREELQKEPIDLISESTYRMVASKIASDLIDAERMKGVRE